MAQIHDLPLDLLFIIASYLNRPSVLSAALASKRHYALWLPVLEHTIILTQFDEPSIRGRIANGDPTLSYIHRVQVGRYDRQGHAGRWNLLDIADLLAELPSLLGISMVGGSHVKGWDGLLQLGDALPNLANVAATLYRGSPAWEWVYGEGSTPTRFLPCSTVLPRPWTGLTRLEVTILERCAIPERLPESLPSLESLTLRFPDQNATFHGVFPFFAHPDATFARLHTLRLLPNPCRFYARLDQLHAFGQFLERHARTFATLAFPAWKLGFIIDDDVGLPQFLSPSAGFPVLSYLETGAQFAAMFQHEEWGPAKVKITEWDPFKVVRGGFARTRVLTITPGVRTPLYPDFLVEAFPVLEEMHFDVSQFIHESLVAQDLLEQQSLFAESCPYLKLFTVHQAVVPSIGSPFQRIRAGQKEQHSLHRFQITREAQSGRPCWMKECEDLGLVQRDKTEGMDMYFAWSMDLVNWSR